MASYSQKAADLVVERVSRYLDIAEVRLTEWPAIAWSGRVVGQLVEMVPVEVRLAAEMGGTVEVHVVIDGRYVGRLDDGQHFVADMVRSGTWDPIGPKLDSPKGVVPFKDPLRRWSVCSLGLEYLKRLIRRYSDWDPTLLEHCKPILEAEVEDVTGEAKQDQT